MKSREIFAAACEAANATPIYVQYVYNRNDYYFSFCIGDYYAGVHMGAEMVEGVGDVQGLLEDYIRDTHRKIAEQ